MDRAQILASIRAELAIADQARKKGNDGMVRVCARRAAGVAARFWLDQNPRPGWGIDTMSQLRNLARDDSFPPQVREAAQRLSTQVTPQFTSPFRTDPIVDSQTIIGHLLGTDTTV